MAECLTVNMSTSMCKCQSAAQLACGNGDIIYRASKQGAVHMWVCSSTCVASWHVALVIHCTRQASKEGRTSRADYACCDKSTNEEQQLVRLPAATVLVSCVCNSGRGDISSYTEYTRQLCQPCYEPCQAGVSTNKRAEHGKQHEIDV